MALAPLTVLALTLGVAPTQGPDTSATPAAMQAAVDRSLDLLLEQTDAAEQRRMRALQEQALLAEAPIPKSVLRTTAAEVGALALGTLWYDVATEVNAPDWDFEPTLEGFSRRVFLGQGIRFDDNPIGLNVIGHPLAGAGYYLLARSSGLNRAESFLASFLTSATWELIPEIREVVAINDLVITPVAGYALAESFLQVGGVIAHANPMVRKVARFLSIDPRLVREYPEGTPWHRFEVWTGAQALVAVGQQRNGPRGSLGLQAVVMDVPGYDRAGKNTHFGLGPSYSRLAFDIDADAAGLSHLSFRGDSAYASHSARDVEKDGEGGLRGVGVFTGVFGSYAYEQRLVRARLDHVSVTSPAGAMVDLTGYVGRLRLRLNGTLSPALVAISSAALPAFSINHDLATAPAVMRNEGYYFGLGLASAAELRAEYGRLELIAEIRNTSAGKIQGLDREGDRPVSPLDAADQRLVRSAALSYQTPLWNVKVKLRAQDRLYTGQVEGLESRHREMQYDLQLVLPVL